MASRAGDVTSQWSWRLCTVALAAQSLLACLWPLLAQLLPRLMGDFLRLHLQA